MAFTVGSQYTRTQIQQQLGGGVQSYLPNRNGRVTCGCFGMDLNPRAPREVLVGSGPRIKESARMLVRQGGPIPVFVKRASNAWEYMGRFRVKRHSTDPAAIAAKAREAGRTDVYMLLELEAVD